MNHKFYLVCILILSSFYFNQLSAQDIITLKDGRTIKATIIEMNDYEIKYNEIGDEHDIIFSIDRALIGEIKFNHGREETHITPGLEEGYFLDDKEKM